MAYEPRLGAAQATAIAPAIGSDHEPTGVGVALGAPRLSQAVAGYRKELRRKVINAKAGPHFVAAEWYTSLGITQLA